MLNKRNFDLIKKNIDAFDAKREECILLSRTMVRHSKKIIYALHRDDMKNAGKSVNEIKSQLGKLQHLCKQNPKLLYSGSTRIAVQEYVEALAYYEFVKNGKVIDYSRDFMDEEYYLLGLCDLTGELVRKAVNSGLKEKYKMIVKIREIVDEIYSHLMQLDLRNSELRRKFDGIKWDLRKLDDLVFQLKIKGVV